MVSFNRSPSAPAIDTVGRVAILKAFLQRYKSFDENKINVLIKSNLFRCGWNVPRLTYSVLALAKSLGRQPRPDRMRNDSICITCLFGRARHWRAQRLSPDLKMASPSLRSFEYLEGLPGTTFKRLYRQPSTALAIFRRMLTQMGIHKRCGRLSADADLFSQKLCDGTSLHKSTAACYRSGVLD